MNSEKQEIGAVPGTSVFTAPGKELPLCSARSGERETACCLTPLRGVYRMSVSSRLGMAAVRPQLIFISNTWGKISHKTASGPGSQQDAPPHARTRDTTCEGSYSRLGPNWACIPSLSQPERKLKCAFPSSCFKLSSQALRFILSFSHAYVGVMSSARLGAVKVSA